MPEDFESSWREHDYFPSGLDRVNHPLLKPYRKLYQSGLTPADLTVIETLRLYSRSYLLMQDYLRSKRKPKTSDAQVVKNNERLFKWFGRRIVADMLGVNSTELLKLPLQPENQDSQKTKTFKKSMTFGSCKSRQAATLRLRRPLSMTSIRSLFSKGAYAAIPEAEFVLLSWRVSEGRNWQEDGSSETWEFCRHLRAHPKFESLAPAALIRKLRCLIHLDEEHLEAIAVEFARVKMAKGKSHSIGRSPALLNIR